MSIKTNWVQKEIPAIILAPMEGVMDAPMRALMTERGGVSYCVSEFLRISQEVPPSRVFFDHIPELKSCLNPSEDRGLDSGVCTPSGTPIQLQLLGGHPERLARSAYLSWQVGFRAIDLNFGCPAPTVNRHDGGASLLRYPDRIFSIVKAVRDALPPEIPVSAKLRLGWESMEDIYLNAEQAYLGGASWVTIHARTKMQGYRPPAHWSYIGEIRKRLPIPVVANGEIWSLDDFKRCQEATGCLHFMVGRGALANPDLVSELADYLGLSGAAPSDLRQAPLDQIALGDGEIVREHWKARFLRLAELSEPYSSKSQYTACRIKQWIKYAELKNNLPWAGPLKRAKSLEELFGVLDTPFDNLQEPR